MPTTGADLLIEALIKRGVKHLFSLSGNQILPVYDATIGRDIDLIHTRHEATAVHMADGWGRLTEEPGVALLTAGPGHCNAVTALYVARMAESPLILLSGNCPRAQIGRGAFQEMDQVAIVQPVCKAAWMVEDAARLEPDIARAFAIARSGRPGPVFLSLPTDVVEATPSERPKSEPQSIRSPTLTGTQVEDLLDLISAARRPLILAGPAMARPPRWKEVAALAEIMGVPALPMESPRGVDDPWLHGAVNCLARADLVLLLGKKLDFTLKFGQPPFFARDCRFAQIEVDEEQLRSGKRVVLRAQADPIEAVRQLSAAAEKREWPENAWSAEVDSARRTTPVEWETVASQDPIHPLEICRAIQPYLNDGAVFVSDGGEFGQWAQAGLEARCRLINGPSGAIGSSLGLALAARLRHPTSPVFVFQGDGTFGYHALDFDTALRYHLPIVSLVGNDALWNAEHQLQIRNYGADRTVGCELLPSRYDKVVEALGGHGEFVQEVHELAPAVERSLAAELPACINVAINPAAAPTFRSEPSI